MNRQQILSKAIEYVTKDRNATHGEPEDNFRCIAELQTAYLNARIRQSPHRPLLDPLDVAVLNILQKVARLVVCPEHLDSWIDIAGYAACGGGIATDIILPAVAAKDIETAEPALYTCDGCGSQFETNQIYIQRSGGYLCLNCDVKARQRRGA